MSMKALRWVRPIRRPAPQKAVLWVLADQANDAGECWPSMAQLVEATCLGERCIQGALISLTKDGLIEREIGGGRGRATVYRLPMQTPHDARGNGGAETPHVVRDTPQEARGNGQTETPHLVHETPHLVRNTPHLVRETPHHMHPNPQEPSVILNQPKKKSARLTALPVEVPAWLPADAWADWCHYRRGKQWTQKAAELSVRKLAELRAEGHDPKAVIEQSIANGWRGLFPVKASQPAGFPAQPSKLGWMLQ